MWTYSEPLNGLPDIHQEGQTTIICLRAGTGNTDAVIVDIAANRDIDPLAITFDMYRDGWVIEQIKAGVLTEVAFIPE